MEATVDLVDLSDGRRRQWELDMKKKLMDDSLGSEKGRVIELREE